MPRSGCEAELVADEPITDRTKELAAEYKSLVIANLQKRDAWQVIDTVEKMTDPSVLADSAGWAPYLTNEQKREVLETPDVTARLELLIGWTRSHLAEMDVSEKIGKDVREGMEKSQREFLLRQQLAAIRKELGEGEPDGADDFRPAGRAGRSAGEGPRSRHARGRPAGAGQRPEPGIRLDPDLAGHGAGDSRGRPRPRTRPT